MESENIICSYGERKYLAGAEILDSDGECKLCLGGKWEEEETDTYANYADYD
jgi:hypothetical protein